jgi:DNA-binding LacI/PurR family transcriptional regulator
VVTLKDVAAHAGVSPGTVSKVINNARHVKLATRASVLQAIAELDYRPSLYASTLRNKRSYTVGIVTERPLMYEYVAAALSGLLEQLAQDGLAALVVELGATNESPRESIAHFRRRHVDGMIHIGSGLAAPADLAVPGWTPPRVYLFTQPDGLDGPLVQADEIQGARTGTQHLLDLGHRRIAFIGGPSHSHSARSRFLGFQRALAEHGLDAPASPQRHGHWSEEHGFEAIFDLLAHREDFTAVFAANDFIAAGALHALQALGRRVPQDVAVLGFDDNTVASLVRPRLTTIALPGREMGRAGARALAAVISGTPAASTPSALPCRLVLRHSTVAG